MENLKLLQDSHLRAACQPPWFGKVWKFNDQRPEAEAAGIASRQFLPGINHASSLRLKSGRRWPIWVD
jgi:hypothetical protein